jgi:PAS domain S-box-containing protein
MGSDVPGSRARETSQTRPNPGGNEVSCRVLGFLFQELEKQGAGTETLTAGVPYTLEHLLDRRARISWSSFCRLMKNAGSIWTDAELVEVGRGASRSRWARPLGAVLSLLYTGRGGFQRERGKRWGPEKLFATCVRATPQEIGPNHYELEVRMQEGYESCHEMLLVSKGFLIGLPNIFGLKPGVVKMEEFEGGAFYDIRFPPRSGIVSGVRRLLTWPFSIRTAARELREALELLDSRSQALEEEISARGVIEESLRESEERFRQLSGVAFEGIMIHDHGIILEANETLARMTGFDRSELIGMDSLKELVAPEHRDLVIGHIQTGYEGSKEATGVRKDGSTFDAEVEVREIEYRGRRVRVCAVRDISERKRADAALRESEERYRRLTENAHDMIDELDAEGRFAYASPKHREITGHEPEELVGTSAFDLMEPPDLEKAETMFRDTLMMGVSPTQQLFRVHHKDGTRVWCESSGATFTTSSDRERSRPDRRGRQRGAVRLREPEPRQGDRSYRRGNPRNARLRLDAPGRPPRHG